MKGNPFPSSPVLIVDDESLMLRSMSMALRSEGINNLILCEDARKVLKILREKDIEVILLDLIMPYISGEELLVQIKQDFPDIPVIVITGVQEVETAVKCMKAKAFDYMVKPVERMRLVSGVLRAIEIRELQRENRLLKEYMLTGKLKNPDAFKDIITRSKKMIGIFQYVESIAKSPYPVLITGETGVGKELIARAIHTLSGRKRLVSINVAGIDPHIFSDTLFGHVKGAFTGANSARKGLIEQAKEGTLLLDEIGDLDMESQIKLLRLIQEKEYFPLGSDLPKRSYARIIATTNRDLFKLQKEGAFRKDLFYRLSTHHIHIPPLRERKEDIPLLFEHFLNKATKEIKREKIIYPDEVISVLENYAFPGNVRELQTMIYDAVSNTEGEVLPISRFRIKMQKDSQLKQESKRWIFDLETLPTLDQAIKLLIKEALRRTNNNKSLAARTLGISRQRLTRLLDK